MAKLNEIVSDVDEPRVEGPLESQSKCHSGLIQCNDDVPREQPHCKPARPALCSGELEGSKIENSVPRKGEVLDEMAPAVKSMAVENGHTDANPNLISLLRERISALEGQLGAIKDSSPAKGPTKSSELWCQLVTSNEKIRSLEQRCEVLQKQISASKARIASTNVSRKKEQDSTKRSEKSKKYLRKLEEAQKQIAKLQTANEEWSRLQSTDAAEVEELKKQFIECAGVLQEHVKFSAELIVEKHRLETELEDRICSENSLRETVTILERDLSESRERVASMRLNLSTLEGNLRETCSELSEETRVNDRLRKYLAETERSHKIEIEFLNMRLVQASNFLAKIHETIKNDKKKSKLLKIASRVMKLNKGATVAANSRETTSSQAATDC